MTNSRALTRHEFRVLASDVRVILDPCCFWNAQKAQQIAKYLQLYDGFCIDEFSHLRDKVAYGDFIGVIRRKDGGENLDSLCVIFPSAAYEALIALIGGVPLEVV